MIKKILFGLVAAGGLLIGAGAFAQPYTAEQVETARAATDFYKQKYWDCLTGEAQKMLSSQITAEDFRSYLPGTCPTEKQDFRVPFVDYMAMKFPDMKVEQHLSAFDGLVQAAIDNTVTGFIRVRTGG